MITSRVLPHAMFFGALAFLAGCGAPATKLPLPAELAVGAAAAKPEVHEVSGVDVIPQPTLQVRPKYPEELRRQARNGEAYVDFVVGPDGKVYHAYLMRESEAGFGAAAVEAVLQWQFTPGQKNGQPVWTRMQVPIVFTVAAPTAKETAAEAPPELPGVSVTPAR